MLAKETFYKSRYLQKASDVMNIGDHCNVVLSHMVFMYCLVSMSRLFAAFEMVLNNSSQVDSLSAVLSDMNSMRSIVDSVRTVSNSCECSSCLFIYHVVVDLRLTVGKCNCCCSILFVLISYDVMRYDEENFNLYLKTLSTTHKQIEN